MELGIGLHSFIDGVIYSVTFNVEGFTGMLSALGIILHEFTEDIITLRKGEIWWISFRRLAAKR